MKKMYTSAFVILFVLFFAGRVHADTVYVNVMDNFFSPASINANVGDVIKWTQMEGSHTTTSLTIPTGAAAWNYVFTGVGDSYAYPVTVAGSYSYECTFHPGMTGTFTAVNPLPLIENFDYPVGNLLTQHGWVNHSGSGQFMTVQSGSLSYGGYPSSGVGNHTLIEGGSGSREDVHKTFAPQSSGAVYAAFLVNVSAASATQDYFFHFGPDPISTTFRGRVFVQDDGAGGFKFGISKASTSTVSFTTSSYTYNTTHLVVVKYEYVGDPTGSDDIIKLFINPNLAGGEPGTPSAQNSDTGTDISVGAMALRQGGNVYTVAIDGIRISTTWNDVVPVELTSFTANSNGNNVTLKWTTATELNNSGFEVERKSGNSSWSTLAFVQGKGTTTEAQNYIYSDRNLQSGSYSYRLKQIDFDGTVSYSGVVEVDVTSPVKFELSQNYPNPFNPSTKISFSIPQTANVSLKVFNMLGQEVKVLVNNTLEAGTHSVEFDASGLTSGIYLYKIEAGSFTQVRKMTLLK